MKQALAEAQYAFDADEVPVGAVVVCRNTIIARAHNQTELLNDVTAHAEILAVTAAANHLGSKFLNECTLYVTLEPCLMCAGALFWAQLGTLVYGAHDEKRGYAQFNRPVLHPKTQVVSSILQSESALLLSNFFRRKR
ncbi:nucleoside deaminase [Sphingobacteriales bacterium UPWRP_1]|nr:tRNA-specific adenosine deaminase [Sphingobacteriales bacterium TSM_CSS]PSJ74858.1 nucleoside deaminase [Sphingobacteriales bacterium UPWRP_1]